MTPGSLGRRPLLLLCLVGLLSAGAQEPDTVAGNTTEVAEKVGSCPSPVVESPNANCTENCQSDAGCQGSQKCCQMGCGTSCLTPNDKPGSCPVFNQPIPPLGFCQDKCRTDSDCPSNYKCCKNGCGKLTCYVPVA